MRKFRLAVFFCSLIATTPSHAARCGGDFNAFVASMSAKAQAAGISQAVISQALGGVTLHHRATTVDAPRADAGGDILLERLVEGVALAAVEIQHRRIVGDAGERRADHGLRDPRARRLLAPRQRAAVPVALC